LSLIKEVFHDRQVPSAPFLSDRHPNAAPFFVVAVPHASGDLPGWVPADVLGPLALTHRALDRGAAKLATAMAAHLDARLIKGTVSRLFVDLNRSVESGEAVPNDGGGIALLDGDAAHGDLAGRLAIHHRFHGQLRQCIATAQMVRRPVILIDQHSFARQLDGQVPREVDIGICFSNATPFERALLQALKIEVGQLGTKVHDGEHKRPLEVRRDEPYSGKHPGAFISRHYCAPQVRTVTVEVCDDLLTSDSAVASVAELLARSVRRAAIPRRLPVLSNGPPGPS
jgi:predicted N-formylglutamate amidohydrolase